MKGEVARPVSRRQRYRRRIAGRKLALFDIKLPDEDLIQSQITCQHELTRPIGLDHVRVRLIMAANGEASGRCAGGAPRANLAAVVYDVGCGAELAVRP